MRFKEICLLGGSGFVGRGLASEMTRRGYRIRVLTRKRERHRELLVFPSLDLVETDIHDPEQLSTAMAGCDAAINLVGVLNETRRSRESFELNHAQLPAKVVEACQRNRITRLLHMSALNATADAPSEYLRSKAAGEDAAHRTGNGISVTSFRPSVMFGPGDDFFNRFAQLLRISPLVFPLACPQARFAPAFIEDVVKAFVDSLEDKNTAGERYDLCGPYQYTLQELVEYTASICGLKRRVWGLSDGLSRLEARVMELLPGKPFSTDNYLSMRVDCVCERNGFASLGIEPASVESIVPRYLGHAHRSARYRVMRSHAGRE